MERYYSKSNPSKSSQSSRFAQSSGSSVPSKSSTHHVDLESLPSDPALRPPISLYHPDIRDKVRRAYLQKGPCQPREHNFKKTNFSGIMRRFNPSWFDKNGNWLEYSIETDKAFCLCCYLFKDVITHSVVDAFTVKGFSHWNKVGRFSEHIGGPSSPHNKAAAYCCDLMKEKQSIQTAFDKQSEKTKLDYRTRLNATIDVSRLLLHLGLPFRGHNEDADSSNRGNFLEILTWYAERAEGVGNVVLKNAPGNQQLTSPKIQKEVVYACAMETVNAIIKDIDDDYFAILVDESRDVSHKEQMALALRYVDKRGFVMERFIGIAHVNDTRALSLKATIESMLCQYYLSLSRIRGQTYDGASNMQGEFNDLKALIMKENPSAHCIHCFSHQLQLTLVAVAKNHVDVSWLFGLVGDVLNVLGTSFKRREMIREKQIENIEKALQMGDIQSGRGLNQELGLKRAGETYWGSHFKSLVNFDFMFATIIEVLDDIFEDSDQSDDRAKARGLLDLLQNFDFAFMLILMKSILGITNDLNESLQKKEQDIVNTISLVSVTKNELQQMRDNGYESFMDEVSTFCVKHDIQVPDMDHLYVLRGKSRRRVSNSTNAYHYRVELFLTVIDMQLQELNGRFNERNTHLLLGMSCLNPSDMFSSFDVNKLLDLAKLYPEDFDVFRMVELRFQLNNFIADMCRDDRFFNLKGLPDLSKKLVETKKHITYPHVYLLVKLSLILPVATATVERAFSAMKYIKSDLRNRIGDQFLNDCLVTFIERDVFDSLSNETIMHHFQDMATRRGQLY